MQKKQQAVKELADKIYDVNLPEQDHKFAAQTLALINKQRIQKDNETSHAKIWLEARGYQVKNPIERTP